MRQEVESQGIFGVLNRFRGDSLARSGVHSIPDEDECVAPGLAGLREQQRRSQHFHHLLVFRVFQVVEDTLHHLLVGFNAESFEEHEDRNIVINEFAAREQLVFAVLELQFQCEFRLHCIRLFFDRSNLCIQSSNQSVSQSAISEILSGFMAGWFDLLGGSMLRGLMAGWLVGWC